jgi:hypothetical protein
MGAGALAGALDLTGLAFIVGLIQSQGYVPGKPEGTLESHFESISN